MTIPSGLGTEVLKRTTIHAQSNSATAFRWDGTMATLGNVSGTGYTIPAHHIVTVLSISITGTENAVEVIELVMNDGGNNIKLLNVQNLAAYSTFIWNDKFVLTAGDTLYVNCSTTANVDFLLSYIDQDWDSS